MTHYTSWFAILGWLFARRPAIIPTLYGIYRSEKTVSIFDQLAHSIKMTENTEDLGRFQRFILLRPIYVSRK